jgi:hypothetical protein
MKKIIKLTESDLTKIIKRLVKESDEESDEDEFYYENFKQADQYASDLYFEMDAELQEMFNNILNNIDFDSILKKYQNEFREKYGELADIHEDVYNENITDLMNMGRKNIDFDFISSEISGSILDNL